MESKSLQGNSKARQNLIAAKRLICTHDKWTKRSYARNMFGEPVHFNSGNADRFCALGALRRIKNSCEETPERWFLDHALIKKKIKMPLYEFNDGDEVRHDDIIEIFNMAIKLSGPQKSYLSKLKSFCTKIFLGN